MGKYLRLKLLFFLLPVTCALQGAITPPQITPYDAYAKAEEILKAHIQYNEFDETVATRTLSNFLKELDPLKCYLTKEEIDIYLEPSGVLVKEVITSYQAQNFETFQEIYGLMLKAIERRNSLEAKIDLSNLPQDVDADKLHKEGWAGSEDDLFLRLQKIRSLQKEAAASLDSEESYDNYFKRIAKRRLHNEQDLIGTSKLDQKRQVLAYFLKSFSSALDPHTMYFTPIEAKQFLVQVQQRLFGIGAQLRDDLNGISVVSILPGGPASKRGELKPGDRIVAVNHETIIGLDINEAVELIRGPKGSQVILTVIREVDGKHDRQDISITRDEVVLKDSRIAHKNIPFGDGVISHIHLFAFYQDPTSSSYQDVKNVIEDAKRNHKLHGVVLDLRNNSGGLLPEAVTISGLFVGQGVIASIQDNQGQIQRLRNMSKELVWDGPLVILINRGSASAAEIVSLSMADYGRAIIVGDEHSYGKGTYQSFTVESSNPAHINSKGEHKVTRGKYYTVGGKTPQLTGVPSDIVIPGILTYLDVGEQFALYPIGNDQIDPQFVDDYKDVHPIYRHRLKKMMGGNPQQRSTELEAYIPTLVEHSNERIQNNSNYQSFLSQIKNMKAYDLDLRTVGQSDLQLEEAYNVIKEFITMKSTVKSPSRS